MSKWVEIQNKRVLVYNAQILESNSQKVKNALDFCYFFDFLFYLYPCILYSDIQCKPSFMRVHYQDILVYLHKTIIYYQQDTYIRWLNLKWELNQFLCTVKWNQSPIHRGLYQRKFVGLIFLKKLQLKQGSFMKKLTGQTFWVLPMFQRNKSADSYVCIKFCQSLESWTVYDIHVYWHSIFWH